MDDLISRKAAIEAAFNGTDEWDGGFNPEYLYELPAVDAVPVVHGRPIWINQLDPDAKICMWKCSSLCSVCGDYVAESWKYCPNCGAKMDGEQRLAFADQSGAEYADNPTVYEGERMKPIRREVPLGAVQDGR